MKLINERYENGWLIKKFKTPSGTNFCTREKCEEEKDTFTKPSEKSIEQLKYIKKIRNEQRLEEKTRQPHLLTSDIREVVGKHEKEKYIKEIAEKFITLAKSRNQLAISKDDINELVYCIKNNKTRSKIRRLIIAYLLVNKKVKENRQVKFYKEWQIKPLMTFDGGSWKNVKKKRSVLCGSNKSIVLQKHRREIISYGIV